MYDLGDASKWEFMFHITDKPLLMIPSVDEADALDIDDDEVLSHSPFYCDSYCNVRWTVFPLSFVRVLLWAE